jgi:geranylgeranyl pyrophosphate synthase
MMHAFSLIHDDLPCMDNDTLRRGKPTNHVVYGESTALLAGDALSLLALETLASNPHCNDSQNLGAVKLLSAYAGCLGMCGGQQIDLQSENKEITKDELEALVYKKTGALFAAACELGCIAAGKDDKKRETARLFGLTTGLAFQIADDLLDLRADVSALGKTPGKDTQSGKSTFVSLLGETEAFAYASSLCEQAKGLLDAFDDSEAKESLCAYCDYIITRAY